LSRRASSKTAAAIDTSKVLQTLKHEFFEVLPPTIFFFVAFQVISVTKMLMLREHGIPFSGFVMATVGALVVGKVVLITDKLRFVNKFPDKPLIYNVVWKTFIYVLAALLVRYAEHLLPLIGEYGTVRAANHHLLNEVVWPRFWAIQIWLLVLFFVYTSFREIVRVIGRDEVLKMFLGRLKPGGT
jgi:hypothetical protein